MRSCLSRSCMGGGMPGRWSGYMRSASGRRSGAALVPTRSRSCSRRRTGAQPRVGRQRTVARGAGAAVSVHIMPGLVHLPGTGRKRAEGVTRRAPPGGSGPFQIPAIGSIARHDGTKRRNSERTDFPGAEATWQRGSANALARAAATGGPPEKKRGGRRARNNAGARGRSTRALILLWLRLSSRSAFCFSL